MTDKSKTLVLHQIFSWIQRLPKYTVLIMFIYYLAVVLPHNDFGAWIAKNLDEPLGRDQYNLVILLSGVFGLGVYLYLAWQGIQFTKRKKLRKQIWILIGYLLLTIYLVSQAFYYLVVINIEVIHLLQYAILGVLLLGFTHSYTATILGVLVLGALDELYQYKVLNPSYDYYDFNDVILDVLGGGLGLVLIATYSPNLQLSISRRSKKIMFLVVAFIFILLVLLYYMGILTIYPVAGIEEAPFQLIRIYVPTFWKTIPPNIVYHVVQPFEGLLILGLLAFCYGYLDRFSVPKRPLSIT